MIMRPVRLIFAVIVTCFAGFAAAAGAQPAVYPNKPIRLVIGFAPAGAADFVARSMSDAFAKARMEDDAHVGKIVLRMPVTP